MEHNPGVDLGRVRAAFELADRAHSGQKRKAGTPYVTHCVAAAQICAEMGLDEDSIVAALLHDCIEDTAITHEDIARQFGAEVADIVEGVTKLTRVQFTSREDEQMENLRKMLMAMAKDIRVILIKIADRLHNMRTMEYMVTQKQLEKSLETMEIYAPIAHRLGLQKVKWELEDLSLKYLDPDGYREIITYLDSKADVLNKFMSDVEKKITDRLTEYSIHATVQSRIKHTYSIYRKMYTQKRGLDEIFDLCAFRVIVDDIPDCYNVLGHIHDMFRPVPGRFKDYIGTPKPNGYQSVHTTVLGEEGIMFEVQIRTWEMHRISEYGIAAHWKYKSGGAGVRAGDEEKFAWIRRLLEAQQDTDAQDGEDDLKMEMFKDEVFVVTRLKQARREEKLLRGKEMFESELRRAGLTTAYLEDDELLQTCIRKLSVTSLDDMYAAIGYGGITCTRAVNRFKDEVARAARAQAQSQKSELDRINEAVERRSAQPAKAVQGVLVEGMDNCLIKFSRCCTPVPGDPIIGFITRGQGVSIHRAACPNYLNSLCKREQEGRWLNVSWADKTLGLYSTTLRILARDRNGLILDIAAVLNALNAKVRSLNARSLPEGNALVYVTTEVPDLASLRLIIARIRTLGGVREIDRGNG